MQTGVLYQKNELGYSDGRTNIRAVVLSDDECRLIYDLLLSRKLDAEHQGRTDSAYYMRLCTLLHEWKDEKLPR